MSHVNYCYSAASEPGGNGPFLFFNYYFFSPTSQKDQNPGFVLSNSSITLSKVTPSLSKPPLVSCSASG